MTEQAVRRSIPNWHWAIAGDDWRNEAYDMAIRANITSQSNVLEIGSGTGILSMMAARAGTAHVYRCEIKPVVEEAARQNITRNGNADRITVIEADAATLTIGENLPQRCNVLLHEIAFNDLLAENVLQLPHHARAGLLEQAALYLPERIWSI